MIPADHKLAFTVGDTSPISSRGPTVDGRFKPNYFIRDSKVEFSDGNISSGSSNAAAMYTALLLDYLARYPYFTRQQLLNMQ